MRSYGLYIRACPGVTNPTDLKAGIFALDKARARLGTYQQAVGPVYTEKFLQVWLGKETHIREAEKQIKRHFKDRIASLEAGLSEWVSDVSMEEMLEFIRELESAYFIKFTKAPDTLLPVTMNNYEDLQEWWEVSQEDDNSVDE